LTRIGRCDEGSNSDPDDEHNEDQESEEENGPKEGGDGFWKHAHQSRENGIGDCDTDQSVGIG
jgi:hypothetical protein